MRILLIPALCAAAWSGESRNLLDDGWARGGDIRVEAGLATPVVKAGVRNSAVGDQQAWLRWQPSARLGLRLDRTELHGGSVGVISGLTLTAQRHQAEITSVATPAGEVDGSGTARLDAYEAGIVVGPAFRFDGDADLLRALPRRYQAELLLKLAGGQARGRLGSSAWTRWGWIGTYAVEGVLSAHLGSGSTLGVAIGFEESIVDLRFADTSAFTWRARGVTATVQLGQRW